MKSRWQGRKLIALLLLAVISLTLSPPSQVEAQRTGGKLVSPGLTFLCKASITVAGNSIGPCTFPPPPAGMQWRKIIVYDYVSAYGGGGDTAGYRFNGDTGNNYR